MKAYYKYKNKVTDDLEDAYEIIKSVGRALTENKTDKASTLDNLARAMKKIESARYYIDRE
jgi:hypothetical protein